MIIYPSNQKKDSPIRPERPDDHVRKATPVNLDLVFCIDASARMGRQLEEIKRVALDYPKAIAQNLLNLDREPKRFRLKIVVFRDYLADGENAMLLTDFFEYPEEKDEFTEVLNGIQAFGGTAEGGNALEALAYAMASDWQPIQPYHHFRHQTIILWTNADAHEIGHGKTSPYYDSSLPRDFDELTEWWGDDCTEASRMNNGCKLLLLYVPSTSSWNKFGSIWDNVIFYPTSDDDMLPPEGDFRTIINLLSHND